MLRAEFEEYIGRFNAEDPTAFEDFLAPGMHMLNGTLEFTGIQGMKDHYAKIWGRIRETLDVERFVSDEDTVAIQMHAHFDVLAGEMFDFHGLIMYRLEHGKFADVKVAYNRFIFTDVDGIRTDLGIPH
jgi:hypothetical protein